MSLITENTRRNADKCLECVIKKISLIEENPTFKKNINEFGSSFDIRSSSIEKVVEFAVKQVVNLGCTTCANSDDFKRLYGVFPYEYFKRAKP